MPDRSYVKLLCQEEIGGGYVTIMVRGAEDHYADLSQTIIAALTDFRQEVESSVFPTMEHSYTIEDEELHKLLTQLNY